MEIIIFKGRLQIKGKYDLGEIRVSKEWLDYNKMTIEQAKEYLINKYSK